MDYAKVSAKWWADRLRKVSSENYDNGDPQAMFLATMLAINYHPSDEAIDKFQEKLEEAIRERVEVRGSLTLCVDYNPDYILANAAYKASINTRCLPMKTTMCIQKDKISVRTGFAAQEETIYSE